jgi:hypothetical protein
MQPESPAPPPQPVRTFSEFWQRANENIRKGRLQIDFWLGLAMLGLWFFIFFAVTPLGRFYPFELFTHFQVQYYYIGWALLVIWIGYRLGRRRKLHWINLFLFYHAVLNPTGGAYALRDWQFGEPTFSFGERFADIRIFHANVLYTRHDYVAPITLIRQQTPDLYVLQEMTPASIRHVTSQLKADFPYWFACWSKGPCWILVGSRTPLVIDKQLVIQKRIIVATTRIKNPSMIHGQLMRLVTVHPRTPVLPSWFAERNNQLAVAAHKTRYDSLPTVLIGDFNISIFSSLYNKIFARFEITPDGTSRGKIWALTACRQDYTQPTWPRFFLPIMIPIDHAFVNNHLQPVWFQTLDLPDSDHRAIVADINFTKR